MLIEFQGGYKGNIISSEKIRFKVSDLDKIDI